MILVYVIRNNTIEKIEIGLNEKIPEGALWIDMIDPTAKEELLVESSLLVNTPTREEMNKNEVLSPFYKENDVLYMTITILYSTASGYLNSTPTTFILKNGQFIVTVRYAKPKVFNQFSARFVRMSSIFIPEVVLESLIDAFVNNVADILEKAGNELDNLLQSLFAKSKLNSSVKVRGNSSQYVDIIQDIGRNGNVISKSRESLLTLNRMLIFFGQEYQESPNSSVKTKNRIRILAREVHSLTEYAHFLAQKNAFLLDATLGMISVEQNMIIKVFTVAAAVFMPPTLVASIYGMNFKFMPELAWAGGYPFALTLIALSAVLPYFFFKRKGWL